jgi:8-amino-7-oxononanoate synthase
MTSVPASSECMRIANSPVGAEIVVDGRRYINFGGSSYLGLSGSPQLIEAGVEALRIGGSGYQFPRAYGVATQAHLNAESEAADFFQTESALYIAAGYLFGFVAMGGLRSSFDLVMFDEWAHFSLQDAIQASGIKSCAFRHSDADDLSRKLTMHLRPKDRPLVVSDGMYSTFGEIAPLEEFAQAVAPYDGRLLVDESHSFGVIGATGRGAVEHNNLAPEIAVIGGSTGKGLGVLGGIVPGSEADVFTFRRSPAARGAAAGLPAAAAMCAKSFRYLREHPELLATLRSNVKYLKDRLRSLGLEVGDTVAPIATFKAGATPGSNRRLHSALLDQGIFVLHSHYVGADSDGVIRCSIYADHRRDQMDKLIDALRRIL